MRIFFQKLFAGILFLVILAILTVGAQFGGVLYAERGSGTVFPVDCALVFGSAVYGWNTPGPAMIRRTSTAVRLYKEGKVKKLIVSGGRTSRTDQAEATVMQQYALRQNVPSSAIRTEEGSHSTLENLKLSKPLAQDCKTTVAISDGYHLARILLLAHQQQWGMLSTYPADDDEPAFTHIRSVLREVVANLFYGFHLQKFYVPDQDLENALAEGL